MRHYDIVTNIRKVVNVSNTATISFRTDPSTKQAARDLFESLGMDLSTAINVFLHQAIRENGIPFKVTQESPESAQARQQAQRRDGKSFASVDDLMKDLLDD